MREAAMRAAGLPRLLPHVYSARYGFEPWPSSHRFRMSKFADLHARLLRDGVITPEHISRPPDEPGDGLFLRVHAREYYTDFCDGLLAPQVMRRIGFEWSPQLVERTRVECGGTVLAARLALRHGLACNLGGGTHHAHYDFGSGFTILNDLAIAARQVQHDQPGARVLIVDLDVHQGDGTAAIFERDPTVFTYSAHCGANFPFRKQTSDFDLDLPKGTSDGAYLDAIRATLPPILDDFRPHLVLYDAGVDAAASDALGHLELSCDGLRARDTWVLEACMERGVPVATVIGGGYSKDLDELAWRHSIVFRAAADVWRAAGGEVDARGDGGSLGAQASAAAAGAAGTHAGSGSGGVPSADVALPSDSGGELDVDADEAGEDAEPEALS